MLARVEYQSAAVVLLAWGVLTLYLYW